MRRNLKAKINRLAYKPFFGVANNRDRKRAVQKFSSKINLINFGYVDQKQDEHKVIRGFTVSSSHKDVCYSVGTVNDYNVTIVDRKDFIKKDGGLIHDFRWLIMAFDLHTDKDIPHFFIKANNKSPKPYNLLFGTFPLLQPIKLGTFENYHTNFTEKFTINGHLDRSIEIERLFPDKTARVIGEHFWPLSVEQHEGVLYIYSDKHKITPNLMSVMLENGLWLANYLDQQAELI